MMANTCQIFELYTFKHSSCYGDITRGRKFAAVSRWLLATPVQRSLALWAHTSMLFGKFLAVQWNWGWNRTMNLVNCFTSNGAAWKTWRCISSCKVIAKVSHLILIPKIPLRVSNSAEQTVFVANKVLKIKLFHFSLYLRGFCFGFSDDNLLLFASALTDFRIIAADCFYGDKWNNKRGEKNMLKFFIPNASKGAGGVLWQS